ncbi:hypothetical protein BGZ47_004339 [Haplosporangium gracile]|nr:hypothetical protein BGZ47_004339 [Haplosporangium gracile]
MGRLKIKREATNNSITTTANTTTGIAQAQTATNNSNNTAASTVNTKGKNKRTQDATNINNNATTTTSANAGSLKRKKMRNNAPAPVKVNNAVMQDMPDIALPFFVLDRIRATKVTDGWGTMSTSGNPNPTTTLQPRPVASQALHTNSYTYPPHGALSRVSVQGRLTVSVPSAATTVAAASTLNYNYNYSTTYASSLSYPPAAPSAYIPAYAPTAAASSSSSRFKSLLNPNNATVTSNVCRQPPASAPAFTLAPGPVPAPVLVPPALSVLAPAPVSTVASVPTPTPAAQTLTQFVNPPSSAASASIVVDLTEDDYEQPPPPTHIATALIAPAADQVADLVERFQRNLEDRQEEMNLWCSKISQLMMDSPNLIKAAGQEQGGEAKARALAATEGLSAYGKSVLVSCVDACEAVKKKFVGSAQGATATTLAAVDTVTGSASIAL